MTQKVDPLVTAAPDLLAVAEQAVVEYTALALTAGDGAYRTAWEYLLKQAQAAIAKARGEQ